MGIELSLTLAQLELIIGAASLVIAVIGLLFALRPKPNLQVSALLNDPSIPLGKTDSVQGPDVPNGIGLYIVPSGSSPTSHLSQFYDLRWKKPGESFYSLNEPRFQLKFCVLKVSNLSRSLRLLRLREGEASDLQADLSVRTVSHNGVPYHSKGSRWTDLAPLSWYRRGWDASFTAFPKGDPPNLLDWAKVVSNIERLGQAPVMLIQECLRYPVLDRLPAGRDAFLLLFVSSARSPGFAWTTSEEQLWIPGEYVFRVGIFAKQHPLTEHYFSLRINGWNDFEITPTKPQAMLLENS